ncbi:hypothetical protein KAT80_01770 [Candidatus Pacearchaeota archaeon]|nr:hypothetical protein [Candidatus Pacearchaeota archaeon]
MSKELEKKSLEGVEIEVIRLQEPLIGQKKAYNIIAEYTGGHREEITIARIPQKYQKAIGEIYKILHEHRNQFSKLNILLNK